MKFPFKKVDKISVWEQFGDLDTGLLEKFMDIVKTGREMEMIIREKVVWDAEQMKKYFEGPVVDFIQKCYERDGKPVGKGVVRDGLKGAFIGWAEPNQFGQVFPLSRTELDTPKDGKSPRTRWKEFLKAINNHCMHTWNCELPTYDNTDIGD